jgi:hypothetical protein
MFILYSNIVKDQQDCEHNVKGFHETIHWTIHWTIHLTIHWTIHLTIHLTIHWTISNTFSPDHFKYFFTRPFQILFHQTISNTFSPDHFKYFWRDHSHSFIVIPPISGYPTHFPISIIETI